VLDGSPIVRDVTPVFVDAVPEGRGVHAGCFLRRGSNVRIVGTMTGMSLRVGI
jgi:hypothetical protein